MEHVIALLLISHFCEGRKRQSYTASVGKMYLCERVSACVCIIFFVKTLKKNYTNLFMLSFFVGVCMAFQSDILMPFFFFFW